MGLDYALVHVKYTLPPCALLTLLYRPFFSLLDVYKILFLVTIAVVSTIPWDSYLIRSGVWSYPPDAVLGPTLWSIPLEELFFFVIQTYGVSVLYLCLTKPVLLPAYLYHEQIDRHSQNFLGRHGNALTVCGQLLLTASLFLGWYMFNQGQYGMYMGLIVIWALPFLLLLWSLSSRFMLNLPLSTTVLAIAIPTVYLWMVDTLALRRGTWVIEKDTKLGIDFGVGLDIEEAFFFFVTDCLVVFGLVAFDNAAALLQIYPEFAPGSKLPSPLTALGLLLLPSSCYDHRRILGLREANERLRRKSRSFYLASSTFQGRLRTDLVALYSFCRAADDLVDGAASEAEQKTWVSAMQTFVDKAYDFNVMHTDNFVYSTFPADVRLAFINLPTPLLSQSPLEHLLRGFTMDLQFGTKTARWPIKTQQDLLEYGYCVAGTIAELCLDLVFAHYGDSIPVGSRAALRQAGAHMGKALQIVNIARDIETDAALKRIYIPLDWLKEAGLRPEDVLAHPRAPELVQLRSRLLDLAFQYYETARPAIDQLPNGVRGPMKVATESYMEIGRALRNPMYKVSAGKATVGTWRRITVAWAALNS